MMRMPWWRMFRGGDRREPAPTEAQARDERLSAYIDGEWDATETPALQSELAGSPNLRSAMEGMREVRDALASLREVQAPRPFALAEPPAPVASRLELATRLGAAMTAVLLTVAIIGDVTTGGDVSEPLEAAVAARPELAAAPAAADESTESAAAAAPAVPTIAALAAPAAAPAPAGRTPAAEAEPKVVADEAAGTAEGGEPLQALELWLGAATAILALLAAAQWEQRRRSR